MEQYTYNYLLRTLFIMSLFSVLIQFSSKIIFYLNKK